MLQFDPKCSTTSRLSVEGDGLPVESEQIATIDHVSAGFERVDQGANVSTIGVNPAMSGPSDDSLTYAGATSAAVTDAAPVTSTTTSASMAMPAATNPRQALIGSLTQTIASAHAAGDIATAQIAARTLTELLSAPQAAPHVAPVLAIATARRARS